MLCSLYLITEGSYGSDSDRYPGYRTPFVMWTAREQRQIWASVLKNKINQKIKINKNKTVFLAIKLLTSSVLETFLEPFFLLLLGNWEIFDIVKVQKLAVKEG